MARTCRTASGQQGFTVLELIVVLVLTALLVTVVLGAFSALLRTQSSVGRVSSDLIGMISERERVMAVLNGVFPSYLDEAFQIEGDPSRFQAKTRTPLFGWPGLPTPISLTLERGDIAGEIHLVYEEAPFPAIVLMRLESEEAEFAFANERLQWSEQWPPFSQALRSELLQPTLVQLSWGREAGEVLVVFTASLTDLPLRPSDLPGVVR